MTTLSKKRPLSSLNNFDLPDQQWVLSVIEILAGLWGHLRPAKKMREEPLDGLILTILSQNTSDGNRDQAYKLLKSRFPQWDDALKATHDEIAAAIRPAGLYNIKASRIKETLEIIANRFGNCSLKQLRKMKKEDVIEFLSSLPGVGPKTLACVLLFDLGIPAFPVDTHVSRICKRIGWVHPQRSPREIQEIMELTVPENFYWPAHLDLISHGRNICLARKPKCEICPLNEHNLCLFASGGKVNDR